MNELVQNQTAAEPQAATMTADASATDAPKLKAEDIKKAYFASAQLTEAQTAMDSAMEIATALDLEVVFSFDTDAEFPAGYGIQIIPIAKRVANENVTLGVGIGAFPDVALIASHENGQAFINECVVANMAAKFANAIRPRGDNADTAASIPFSVEDFITSNRPEGVLLAFRTYSSAYVKVLKKKGLDFMTPSILRQILQSAAFAADQIASVPQAKWVQILDSMIARASAENIAVGMLADWKASRDSAVLKDVNVDLSDLDFEDFESKKVEATAAPQTSEQVATVVQQETATV